MASKVLTTLPAVHRSNGRRGLICAGHAVAPEQLPPGAMTVECHRCGRRVVLMRPPVPSEEPPTRFMKELAPPPPPAEALGDQEQTHAVVAIVSELPFIEGEITVALNGPEPTVPVLDLPASAFTEVDWLPGDLGFQAEEEHEEPTVRMPPPIPSIPPVLKR